MKHTKLKWSLLLLLTLVINGIVGQEVLKTISSSGGMALGSGGSASYTIGQIVYKTSSGTYGSITEGVQQPYEISELTGIKEASGINLAFSVYPNPSINYLILKVEKGSLIDIESLSYQLFDINSKLIENKPIKENATTINMANLAPSTYFIHIYTRNNKTNPNSTMSEVKSFKIIKK